MFEYKTMRSKNEILLKELKNERSSFEPSWRDIGDFILPMRPRFFTSDTNRGHRKSQKIIDATATMSTRTLRSGLMSGITSPARPWFKLTTPDRALAEYGPVKEWLHMVGERMSTSFLRSNLYNSLPVLYGDVGTFGTAAMIIEEDFDNVLHTYPMAIGSYYISNNDKLKVDTFFREFKLTVRQVMTKFLYDQETNKIDWSKASPYIKKLYDNGQTEQWIEICHVIRPNENYDPQRVESRYKRYASIYYEKGTSGDQIDYFGSVDFDKVLRYSGYDFFPALCPRWEVTGEDVYGTDCPGMIAIGDVKQLQTMERRSAQGIEKSINPALMGPSSLRNQKVSLLPGDVSYVDQREGMQGLRPIHEVSLDINPLEAKTNSIRGRISKAYYEDLFLMLANTDRRQITAREIEERHEEKLLALGPVLEQLNQDLLDPLIEITFNYHVNQGLLPPPPEELSGSDLKVEYISILAQAQKLVGLASVERFTGYVGNLAQMDQNVLRKVNANKLVDTYGDIVGINPGIIRTDEEVQAIMEQEEQARQAQERMAQMQQAAGAAKDLSQAKLEGDNALNRIIDQAEAGNLVGG